jgi:hypothetical protein
LLNSKFRFGPDFTVAVKMQVGCHFLKNGSTPSMDNCRAFFDVQMTQITKHSEQTLETAVHYVVVNYGRDND